MNGAADLINKFTTYVVNPIILVLFALGVFLFMFGLVEFLWKLNAGHGEEEGKQHMLWGVVGMLIMVSVYGIISLLDNTFSLNVGGTPDTSILNSSSNINFTGN